MIIHFVVDILVKLIHKLGILGGDKFENWSLVLLLYFGFDSFFRLYRLICNQTSLKHCSTLSYILK
jgi:hypothetical protein